MFPVYKWMRKYDDVEMRILVDDAVLHVDEIRLIAQYRADGYDLLNVSPGGDGTPGVKLSSQHKAKIAAALHKLDGQVRRDILGYRAKGLGYREIGLIFGVSHNTVRNVVIGRTYS